MRTNNKHAKTTLSMCLHVLSFRTETTHVVCQLNYEELIRVWCRTLLVEQIVIMLMGLIMSEQTVFFTFNLNMLNLFLFFSIYSVI